MEGGEESSENENRGKRAMGSGSTKNRTCAKMIRDFMTMLQVADANLVSVTQAQMF